MSSIPPKSPIRFSVSPTVGMQFGRWTVIGPKLFSPPRYLCRCECGTEKEIRVYDLVDGCSNGCMSCRRSRGERNSNYRHGGTAAHWQSKLYQVWSAAKSRCCNPKNKDWEFYGGRGILFCEEWLDFGVFQEWAIQNGYREGLELDRQNNDVGYSPANCRFVTHAANSGNRRSSYRLTLFGETKSLKEWSRDPRCLVSYQSLRNHFHKGKRIEEDFES